MILPPPRKGSAKKWFLGVFLLVFSLFNEPIFAQQPIGGATTVQSGQTYTYTASVSTGQSNYSWNVSGGTIVSSCQTCQSVDVVWQYSGGIDGSITFTTNDTQGNFYIETLYANIQAPSARFCVAQPKTYTTTPNECQAVFTVCENISDCHRFRIVLVTGEVSEFDYYSGHYVLPFPCSIPSLIKEICVRRCDSSSWEDCRTF